MQVSLWAEQKQSASVHKAASNFAAVKTKSDLDPAAPNRENPRSPISMGLEQAIIRPMHLPRHIQRFKWSFSFSYFRSNFHPQVMRNHIILRKSQQQINGHLPSERLLCLVPPRQIPSPSLSRSCCFQPTSSSTAALLRLNTGFCSSHPLTACTSWCRSFLLFQRCSSFSLPCRLITFPYRPYTR